MKSKSLKASKLHYRTTLSLVVTGLVCSGVVLLVFSTQIDANQLQKVAGLLLFVLVPALGLGGYRMGKHITRLLAILTSSLEKIASGDFRHRVSLKTPDEFGRMATSINNLAERQQAMTRELEASQAENIKTTAYLYASAEVGQVATSILDIEKMMRLVVELIRARFKLYFVGLFLVDAGFEWAVMKAGTGEAGEAMLERGYRTRMGEGMVGWAIEGACSRMANITSNDEHWLSNSDLPDTQSEAALPLRSRGQVIGALTVHSTAAKDFEEAELAILQTMADQIGIAIDNARLFAESHESLQKMRAALNEANRRAWSETLRDRNFAGYRGDEAGIFQLQNDEDNPEDTENLPQIAIPIEVRGQILGMLEARKPQHSNWTGEEIRLVETLVEQMSVALDGARLYEETRRRAEREHLAGQITSRMRASNDPQEIIQIAMLELRKALHADKAHISIQPSPTSAAPRMTGERLTGEG